MRYDKHEVKHFSTQIALIQRWSMQDFILCTIAAFSYTNEIWEAQRLISSNP